MFILRVMRYVLEIERIIFMSNNPVLMNNNNRFVWEKEKDLLIIGLRG